MAETEEASPPWQDAVSDLAPLLSDPSSDPSEVGRLCASVLDGPDAASLPPPVRSAVTAALLRSHLRRDEFREVVSRCGGGGDGADNILEWAYGLYRLREYGACRDLCEGRLGGGGAAGVGGGHRGLRHVYAQALYRLGETAAADDVYRGLLGGDGDGGDDAPDDADEAEDVLSNALANLASNHTAGSTLGDGDGRSWVESDERLRRLTEDYGGAEGGDGMLQNYDLAYNLATYLLASAEARDSSYRCVCFLSAERWACEDQAVRLTAPHSRKN